jgi:hypothetical protein
MVFIHFYLFINFIMNYEFLSEYDNFVYKNIGSFYSKILFGEVNLIQSPAHLGLSRFIHCLNEYIRNKYPHFERILFDFSKIRSEDDFARVIRRNIPCDVDTYRSNIFEQFNIFLNNPNTRSCFLIFENFDFINNLLFVDKISKFQNNIERYRQLVNPLLDLIKRHLGRSVSCLLITTSLSPYFGIINFLINRHRGV